MFGKPLKRRGASEMNTTTVGLDIAKSYFQVHGVDAYGKTTLQRQLRRLTSREVVYEDLRI
jgi:hypothetical protein